MASQVPRHDLWCASPTPSVHRFAWLFISSSSTVLPCIYFTADWYLFQLWRCCCGEAHKFTDRTFPPNDKLLGREHADIGEVEWILVGTQGRTRPLIR